MTVIREDAANDTAENFNPQNAFMQAWNVTDAEEPSEKGEPENAASEEEVEEKPRNRTKETDESKSDQEVQDEEAETEEGDDGETTEDDESTEEDSYLSEDRLEIKVKHKVDGEEREFAVKDLLRLAGQEAALTRKSQEVATKRKQVDDTVAVQAAAFDKMLQRAQARWEPFSKVDWLTLAKRENVSEEDLTALREEAQHRHDELKFFTEEYEAFAKETQNRIRTEYTNAAKQCIEVLSDPTTGIEGWGEPLYKEMVGYAKSAGVPEQVADNLTDPAAFKLIHKAMLYDKAKTKVSTTKNPAKKKAPPKKIVKTTNSPDAQQRKPAGQQKTDEAMARLRKTGSRDDAANAFLSMWTPDSE